MFTKEIQESEIQPVAIASLPTRPTISTALGGRGFTASEMRAAFDALPRLIISRLNQLIAELGDGLVETLAKEIHIELPEGGYCFGDLLEDFEEGTLVNHLTLGKGGISLGEAVPTLLEKVDAFYHMDENYILDSGRVSERGGVI